MEYRIPFVSQTNVNPSVGTIDLFGPVACERLVQAGLQSIREVFSMTAPDFEGMGFGAGQAANLEQEHRDARSRPVDDFLVLAALGIEHLGRGDSKKLLKHFVLKDLPTLSISDITNISSFGELTARNIVLALPSVKEDLLFLERNLIHIERTPARSAAATDSPVSGKHIVFTSSMVRGSRSAMIAQAEALGATSQSAVNKKNVLPCCGRESRRVQNFQGRSNGNHDPVGARLSGISRAARCLMLPFP